MQLGCASHRRVHEWPPDFRREARARKSSVYLEGKGNVNQQTRMTETANETLEGRGTSVMISA